MDVVTDDVVECANDVIVDVLCVVVVEDFNTHLNVLSLDLIHLPFPLALNDSITVPSTKQL